MGTNRKDQDKATQYFNNLEDAKSHPNAYVSLLGDFGGHVYLVVPAKFVNADEAVLPQLICDLSYLYTMSLSSRKELFLPEESIISLEDEDPEHSLFIQYATYTLSEHVSGSVTNYGIATDSLWLSDRLSKISTLKDEVELVLTGQKTRIRI